MGHLEAVTRRRRVQSGTDGYGNPVFAEQVVALPPARFAPTGGGEVAETGSVTVVTGPSLYWRGQWPDVRVDDRLIVRGLTFEVDGPPAPWRGGPTVPGGLVVKLRGAD